MTAQGSSGSSGGIGPGGCRVTLTLPSGGQVAGTVRDGQQVTIGAAAPATMILGPIDFDLAPVHVRLQITDRGLEAFSEAPSRFSVGGQKRLRSPLKDGDVLVIGRAQIRVGIAPLPAPEGGAAPAPAPPPAAAPPPPPAEREKVAAGSLSQPAYMTSPASGSVKVPPPPPPPPPPPAARRDAPQGAPAAPGGGGGSFRGDPRAADPAGGQSSRGPRGSPVVVLGGDRAPPAEPPSMRAPPPGQAALSASGKTVVGPPSSRAQPAVDKDRPPPLPPVASAAMSVSSLSDSGKISTAPAAPRGAPVKVIQAPAPETGGGGGGGGGKDGWSDDLVALLSGAPASPGPKAERAPRKLPGLGSGKKHKKKKKDEVEAGDDPLSALVSAKAAAQAKAKQDKAANASGAVKGPVLPPRKGLLTAEALKAAIEGPPAFLASLPGDELLHMLLWLEQRKVSGTFEIYGAREPKPLEGKLLMRGGAIAAPLVGDPLAPILEWLAPMILLPRIELKMVYAPPPPVAAEASIRVGALLEEFDRRISGG